MNMEKTLWSVAGLALALATVPALAQGPGRGFGEGRFGEFRMSAPTTGAPYSATMTITRVQKLSDGTTITHTSVVKEARDSSGRLYRETLPENPGHTFTSYSVFDPVSRVSIHWTSDSKQASLMHLPDPSQLAALRGARGPQPQISAQADGAGPGLGAGPGPGQGFHHGNLPPATTESLGSKTIGGLVADGTRSTRVIPAGAEGNDQPITITHETWVSSDLKVELMRTDSDPRFGTTTMERSNISRTEPAAALFQAPVGYAIQEHTPGQRGPAADPLQ
jgi:hypothetical protein